MPRGPWHCLQPSKNASNANGRRAPAKLRQHRTARMADLNVVEMRIWEQSVGAVAPLQGKPGFYEFEYAPAFENSGLELSPLRMPLKTKKRFSFPGLAQDTFHGLPGLLADALPDKFGNALIDEYFTWHGKAAGGTTT